jgi:hypothetical protein
MRCHIEKHPNSQLSGKSIYLVVRDSDSYVMGQHASRIEAERQLRGLDKIGKPSPITELGV